MFCAPAFDQREKDAVTCFRRYFVGATRDVGFKV